MQNCGGLRQMPGLLGTEAEEFYYVNNNNNTFIYRANINQV